MQISLETAGLGEGKLKKNMVNSLIYGFFNMCLCYKTSKNGGCFKQSFKCDSNLAH